MTKRERIQMFFDVLKAAEKKNVGRTKIYYNLGTTYYYFKHLLNIAVENGYISVDDKKYNLTERGTQFLKDWREYELVKKQAESFVDEAENLRKRIEERPELEALQKSFS